MPGKDTFFILWGFKTRGIITQMMRKKEREREREREQNGCVNEK